MALSHAFHERLQQMEETRNQRLSLLQAEKDLQNIKSQLLSAKLSNIRSIQRRCFMLDHKIASQNFNILNLKSQIDALDSNYSISVQQLRCLKVEVEEIEELEKEKDRFYELKSLEMKEFTENVERFVVNCRMRVQELQNNLNELNSTFMKLHDGNGEGDVQCSQIAAAEKRRSELLAMKESISRNLASNYQLREVLRKELQSHMFSKSG
ncbi:Herpesvirus UL139, cytomegalovirus [Dillenia turbinata]|uniref:Herpesvirus UL139, cytomegalovirus n=1 Tax=Dillenia turbinata TaxID=194707 RepID=A0AAN8ZFQ3_9MAGN